MKHDSVRPRYWGVGFIWMWVYAAYSTSAVYPERTGSGINADPSWLASSVAVTAALFLVGAFWARRSEPPASNRVAVVAGVLSAVGTVASALSVGGQMALLMPIVSGVLSGVGTGVLLVLWLSLYCRIPIAESERAICVSCAFPLLGALVFPYLTGVVGVAAAASLPVLSACTYAYANLRLRAFVPAGPGRGCSDAVSQTGSFLGVMLVVFAFYFAGGCVEAMRDSSRAVFDYLGFDIVSFFGAGFGIVLVFLFSRFSMRITFRELLRWLMPLLVVALALFPWLEPVPMFLQATILNILDTSMQALSLMCLVVLVKRGLLNINLAVGVCQGIIQLGVLMGNVAGWLALPYVEDGSLNAFVLVLVLVCLVVVAQALFPSVEIDTLFDSDAPVVALGGRNALPKDDGESPSNEAEADDPIDLRCKQLAQEYGLSARELEVLGYLARGRSQPYIRDKLVLSRNTVATHVKHVYTKLGVHSKQEVIDLFG